VEDIDILEAIISRRTGRDPQEKPIRRTLFSVIRKISAL